MELRLTADGSRTLYSERFGQTMHSHKGALSESRYVFLAGAGVAARLAKSSDAQVLEVGFGTGLNFFISADKALGTKGRLEYVGLEQILLTAETVTSLDYASYLQAPDLLTSYLDFRRQLPAQPTDGSYRFQYEGVQLTLLIGDAAAQSLAKEHFHAVYQDAFSPDANPDLWTPHFLAKLYASLDKGGVLATYSVKGEVRRRLQALGFQVEKRPGPPGGKREVLVARKR